MKGAAYWLSAVSALAALAAGAWFWSWQQPPQIPQAASPAVVAPPPAPTPAEPAIKHPIETALVADLPALAESDTYVTGALTDLLGSTAVLKMLQTGGFVRRVVATVDNLARRHAAPALWPVNPAPGRFAVDANSVVKVDNSERYTAFVLLVESVDTARAVALYVRLYPLFQRAYVELGYPDGYFNDRLVAVIDHLLATPVVDAPLKVELTEVKGEIKSQRPWVRYQFSDPALEALSAGQKMLLRAGPVNARRLKARLADIRRQVAAGAVASKP